jgi:hypothetical protein
MMAQQVLWVILFLSEQGLLYKLTGLSLATVPFMRVELNRPLRYQFDNHVGTDCPRLNPGEYHLYGRWSPMATSLSITSRAFQEHYPLLAGGYPTRRRCMLRSYGRSNARWSNQQGMDSTPLIIHLFVGGTVEYPSSLPGSSAPGYSPSL